jgi:hypothetical protein
MRIKRGDRIAVCEQRGAKIVPIQPARAEQVAQPSASRRLGCCYARGKREQEFEHLAGPMLTPRRDRPQLKR